MATYPHVKELRYRISQDARRSYVESLVSTGQVAGFDYTLQSGSASFRPTEHFANLESARSVLEPALRAWELGALIQHKLAVIRFKFVDGIVVAEPPRSGVIQVSSTAVISITGQAVVVVVSGEYPKPSEDLEIDSLIEDLTPRFERILENDSVLANGYAFLDRLEKEFGGRQAVATALGVRKDVLGKLGTITSTRGSPQEARKFREVGYTGTPLSDAELRWIPETVASLLKLAASRNKRGARVPPLSLSDLPPVP